MAKSPFGDWAIGNGCREYGSVFYLLMHTAACMLMGVLQESLAETRPELDSGLRS